METLAWCHRSWQAPTASLDPLDEPEPDGGGAAAAAHGERPAAYRGKRREAADAAEVLPGRRPARCESAPMSRAGSKLLLAAGGALPSANFRPKRRGAGRQRAAVGGTWMWRATTAVAATSSSQRLRPRGRAAWQAGLRPSGRPVCRYTVVKNPKP